MGKPKYSLTDWPDNLKDVIDWLAAVGGGFGTTRLSTGKYSELADEFEKLPDFTDSTTKAFGKSYHPSGFISKLADGLGYGFLGYQGQGGSTFSGRGIIEKNGGYSSAYAGLSWPQGTDRETCALIFLGCAVTVYYCMSYVYWRCSTTNGNGGWAMHSINGTSYAFGKFMVAMGFDTTRLNGKIQGSKVAESLTREPDGFSELEKPGRQNSYSDFLQQLESRIAGNPLNHPLASCYKLATAYFKQANASDITSRIETIKQELITRSRNSESSYSYSTPNPYEPLKELITQLLSEVQKFNPQQPQQETPAAEAVGAAANAAAASGATPGSVAASGMADSGNGIDGGSIAGTLSTLGLGGGAVAAYLFNLGGAKTFVNGLLKIG
ncbi:variant erythrocyte surface antigen-1 family protein [Babesia caballi]|uniref:Variant erythrocyte surface antigen-1 family protein n=1 Tax=Babesia caballi TaxID=5871 RepID=A0AAV4LWX8_BABCB|nr:variant erythrocyte surface antigen-1 family protein [Babesia caballi]